MVERPVAAGDLFWVARSKYDDECHVVHGVSEVKKSAPAGGPKDLVLMTTGILEFREHLYHSRREALAGCVAQNRALLAHVQAKIAEVEQALAEED